MKELVCSVILLLSILSNAQNNAVAPINPVALAYKVTDLGLVGPVKSAGNLEFDKQGRLVSETGDETKKLTYSDRKITVEKYGAIYIYQLNDKNLITSYSVEGSDGKGFFIYDSNGNLIEEKSTSDGYENRLTYSYDDQNRLIKKTEWYGEDPYSTVYDYYGSPELLEITITVGDDRSSRVTNKYQNGVFVNRNFHGADDWENVVLDTYGNWTSYDNVVYGTSEKRQISYYK